MIPSTPKLEAIYRANEEIAFKDMTRKHEFWAKKLERHNISILDWFHNVCEVELPGEFSLEAVKEILEPPITFNNPMQTNTNEFGDLLLVTSQRKISSSLVRQTLTCVKYPDVPLTWKRKYSDFPAFDRWFVSYKSAYDCIKFGSKPKLILKALRARHNLLKVEREIQEDIISLQPLALLYLQDRYPQSKVTFKVESVDIKLASNKTRPMDKLFAYIYFNLKHGVKVCLDHGPNDVPAMSRLKFLDYHNNVNEITRACVDIVADNYLQLKG